MDRFIYQLKIIVVILLNPPSKEEAIYSGLSPFLILPDKKSGQAPQGRKLIYNVLEKSINFLPKFSHEFSAFSSAIFAAKTDL